VTWLFSPFFFQKYFGQTNKRGSNQMLAFYRRNASTHSPRSFVRVIAFTRSFFFFFFFFFSCARKKEAPLFFFFFFSARARLFFFFRPPPRERKEREDIFWFEELGLETLKYFGFKKAREGEFFQNSARENSIKFSTHTHTRATTTTTTTTIWRTNWNTPPSI
jgi:hypothetical protein